MKYTLISTTAWWNTQNNESLRDCASTSSAADVDLSNCSRLAHRVCKGQDVIKRLNFILWHLEVRLKQAQQQNLTINAELGWCFYRMGIFCKFWGVNALLHQFCVLLTTPNPVLRQVSLLLTKQTACVWSGRICLSKQWQTVWENYLKTVIIFWIFVGWCMRVCMHVSFTVILFRATILPFHVN